MTLTEISFYSRRLAPFAMVGVLMILIMFYAVKILFLYLDTQKASVVEANPVFGAIKPLRIVDSATPSGQITYFFDTIEGRPITATASANVYFLPKNTTQFGYREKVALMAQAFGIDTEATRYRLTGQQAEFVDDKHSLTVDIASFNFSYQYALDRDPALFDNVRVPDSTEAEQEAINFLKKIDRYPENLAQGKVNLVYLRYEPSTTQLTVIEDPNLANMVEADIYRPDIGEYPIVSPKYFNSQNYVAMVFNEGSMQVVKAQVKNLEASDEQVGVYPLKTGDEAYQKLQAGDAIYVSLPPAVSEITIKKMFLGYLDPDIYQEYLQPVYVFLGDNNFVAYVAAVADAYLAK